MGMCISWIPTGVLAVGDQDNEAVVNIVYTIGEAAETHVAELSLIGTTKIGSNSGNAYLAALPEGAKVQSYTWNSEVSVVQLLSKGGLPTGIAPSTTYDHGAIIADTSNYLQNGEFQGVDGKAAIAAQGWNTLDDNAKAAIPLTGVSGFILLTAKPRAIVYVQIPTAEVNTESLQALVESVPTDGYHTKNDRWNGKNYSNQGFWLDMQSAYQQATELLNGGQSATQSAIDDAAEELEKEGISLRVIDMHTIKPIDEEIIVKAASETKAIITAEEHSVIGGLGAAVAEVVVKKCPVKMAMVGIQDRFGQSGKPQALMEEYHITAADIAKAVKETL